MIFYLKMTISNKQVPHYTDTRAGKTALHFAAEAAEYGFTDAVEMLLEAGADPTVRAVNERGPGGILNEKVTDFILNMTQKWRLRPDGATSPR